MSPSNSRTQRLQAHLAANATRVPAPNSARPRARTISSSSLNNIHATIALSLLVVGASAKPINLAPESVARPAIDLANNVRQILTNPQQASFASAANAVLHPSLEDLTERFGHNIDDLKSTISHFLEGASGLISGQQADITPHNDGLQLVSPQAPEAGHEPLPASQLAVDNQGSPAALPAAVLDDAPASPISSEPDSPRIMPGDFPNADYTPPPPAATNNQKTLVFASAGAASVSLLFAIAAVQSIRQLRASSKKSSAVADIEAAQANPEEDLSRALIVREKGIKWARETMVTNEKGDDEDGMTPRRLVPRGASLAQKKSVEDLMGTEVPAISLAPLAPAKLAPLSASDPAVIMSEKDSQLAHASTTPSTSRPPQLARFPTAANLDLTLLHLPVTMSWLFHFVLVFFGWFGFVSRPGIARALVNSF